MVDLLRPGRGEEPGAGVAPPKPWPLPAAFLAALLLAVPALWLYNRLEPGPDGGGVPDRVLEPLFWAGSALALAVLAWFANRRAPVGMRVVVAFGLAGLGFAAGLVLIAFVALATTDCNMPTTADWREPGLRDQYTATRDYEDDYHRVHFRDDGGVDVRWSDGPIRLRMVVDAGDGVFVTGNLDGMSELVLKAAVEAHFAQHGLSPPTFDQFSMGRALC